VVRQLGEVGGYSHFADENYTQVWQFVQGNMVSFLLWAEFPFYSYKAGTAQCYQLSKDENKRRETVRRWKQKWSGEGHF
jgi:hypothetical protein